jgi:O-antigen/teichoic acid export membrane protein
MAGAKSLIYSSVGYIASNFLNRLIPFVLLPLLTFYLTTAQMGVVSMFQLLTQFAVPLAGLGMAGIISIEYVKLDTAKIKQLVAGSLIIVSFSCLILGLLSWLFVDSLVGLLDVPSEYILLLPLLAFVMVVVNIYTVLLQMSQRVLAFSVVKISISIVEVAITAIMIIGLTQGADGRIEAIIYSNIGACIVILLILWKKGYFPGHFAFEKLKSMMIMGSPLIVYELCFLVVLMTDRLFIKHMYGIETVGIYMVGMQLGLVIGLFENSVIRAWIPWFFRLLHDDTEQNKRTIVKSTYAYVGLLVLAAVVWIGMSGWVVDVFIGPEFKECKVVIPWVASAFMFMGMYKIAAQYLFFFKKTQTLMAVSILVAVINIPITWWLVQTNGMQGAAQATLLSYIAAFFCTFYLSQKCCTMPFFRLKHN